MKQLIYSSHFNWISLSVNIVLLTFLTLAYFHVQLDNLHLDRIASLSFKEIYSPEKVNVEDYPIDFLNATAVFNAVHGAMKQRDADLFPNGVTFIPAYIPANLPLYHSTSSAESPTGMEWIAFDYEFSYDFAHFPRSNRPRNPHHPPGGPPGGGPPGGGPPGKEGATANRTRHPPWAGRNSFLYTFKSSKPLDKVIYLDGASASKTDFGPMDQQLILSRQRNSTERVNEYIAGEKICKWGKEFGLQGIIRLEIGFEMILCDFDDVTLVGNVTLNNVTDLLNFPNESQNKLDKGASERSVLIDAFEAMSGFEHLVAGEESNIGEKRVSLDFSRMVTPLNKTWLNSDPYLRRMNNLSMELKEGIISDLEKTIGNTNSIGLEKTDWQLLTERIEKKFGPILVNLNNTLSLFELGLETSESPSLEETAGNITQYLYNYVRRYSEETIKDWPAKREKAFRESLQDYLYITDELKTSSEVLIYSSIREVYSKIFDTLFDLFEASRDALVDTYVDSSEKNRINHHEKFSKLKVSLNDLLNDLRWAIFTRCSSLCGWDEVCYTPTWGPGPFGWGASKEWFENDGDVYKIKRELQCVSYKDLLRSK